jgi:hypothetical protein
MVVITERNLFVRERSDGLYHVITYLMAKMAEELLLAAVATVGISACEQQQGWQLRRQHTVCGQWAWRGSCDACHQTVVL